MTIQASGTVSFLFVDAGVDAPQQLLTGLQPGVRAYILDANQDGIRQITNILKVCFSQQPVQAIAIHIVAHAIPGSVRLGNTELSLDTLHHYTEHLKAWCPTSHSAFLTPYTLSFYACNLAGGDAGEEFIARLHQLTGANIYASTTKIGNAELGGNWDLDVDVLNSQNSGFNSPDFIFSDAAIATYPAVLVDTDGDGEDDITDQDDDNDGILDSAENPAESESGTITFNSSNLPAPAETFTNIGGSGLDATLSHNSPGNVTPGTFIGADVWTLLATDGVGVGQTAEFFLDFSANPLNEVSFTIRHINGDTFSGGDEIEIFATTDQGTQLTNPILTPQDAANASYTIGNGTATGSSTPNMASANGPVTGGPEGNLDVTFDASTLPPGERIESVTLLWRDVGGVAATHGVGLSDLFISADIGTVGTTDTDGDGVQDHLDLDSDNDGISDLEESGQDSSTVDADGDGRHNDVGETYTNGVANDANGGAGLTAPSSEITVTFDRDDFPDESSWELRSPSGVLVGSDDTSGADFVTQTFTVTEAGNYSFTVFDTFGDGLSIGGGGNGTASYTIAVNGTTVITSDADLDFGTSVAETIPVTIAGGVGTVVDTDSDGTLDYLDLDSDGDGIPDAVEAQATSGYTSTSDGTSVPVDANTGVNTAVGLVDPEDTDNDGTPDYIDTDSDNGLGDANGDDATESGNPSVGETYPNPDGSITDEASILATLTNTDTDTTDVDFRSLDLLLDATDNTNTVVEDTTLITNGNLLSDDDGFGIDTSSLQATSQLIWENEFADEVTPTSATVDGVTVDFTFADPGNLSASDNFTVETGSQGNHAGYFEISFRSDITQAEIAANPTDTATFSFSQAVSNLSFSLLDVDSTASDDWQDQVTVLGFNGGVAVPVTLTSVTGNVAVAGDTATGSTSGIGSSSTDGNVLVTANSPVDEIQFVYQFGPLATDDPLGSQLIGISDLSWDRPIALTITQIDAVTDPASDVTGTYGTLDWNSDGTYSYTLNNTNLSVQSLNTGDTLTDTFTYTVRDDLGNTDTATLTVTIDGQNDNNPPDITSDGGGLTAALSIAENTTAVANVESTDLDGETENGGGLTYSLTGGADQALFTLDLATGDLSFITPPDFENPGDADGNNDYEVEVTVTDAAGANDVQTLTVNVTDVVDTDNDGIDNNVDLDDDNDGIVDIDEGFVSGPLSNTSPPPAPTGEASATSPQGVWEVLFYGGHFGVQNAVNPADQVAKDPDNNPGTPVLYGQGYTTFGEPTYTFIDPDINNSSSDPAENPANVLRANGVNLIDNPTSGAYPDTNTSGTYSYIFRREMVSSGTLTVGEPGAYFDDFAEVFINGVLVDSIDQFTSSLPAGDVITVNVNPGDIVELRLTNGASLGGFNFTLDTSFEADSTRDTDGDGIADHLDLDSDNDGISDLVESGADAATLDPDNNGTIDGVQFVDDGTGATSAANNGLADAIETTSGTAGTGTTPAESTDDTDTIPNYLDLDSDGDSIPDAVEAQLTADFATNFGNDGDVTDGNDDSDGDGVLDVYDSGSGFGGAFNTPVNTDILADGADYLDTDSDEDGETDADEADGVAITAPTFTDPDGSVNNPLTDLENADSNIAEPDYRSLNNNPPVITSDGGGDTATLSIPENTTTVTNVESTDADGETENGGGLTYSLTGGADQGLFTLNPATGDLSFTNAPDFETPGDADGNNAYEVQVTVTDAAGATDVQTLTVTVTDVVEAAPPVINEFVLDHTGADTSEFIEFLGEPNTDYSSYTLLQVEGDSDSSSIGTIDSAISLGTTDANGFFTTPFSSDQFENGTLTLLLVQNFTGSVGDDVDTNDDGVFDVTPWNTISDDVAITDGGAGDQTFSTVVLTNVDGASRIPNGTDTDSASDFVANDFDGTGLTGFTGTPENGEALNTPNATNRVIVAPVATPSTSAGDEDNNIPVDLTGTDSDGTVDFVTVDTLPPATEGILYLPDGSTTVTVGTPITATDAATLIFTPEPNFNGDVTIPFTVIDNDGAVSALANEVITVNDVNDPPVATPSTSSGDEDTDIPVDLTGTDSDGTVDFVTVDTLPPVAEGILYLPDGTTPVVAGTPITAADAANLIFTPEPDFNGDVTIPFTVTDDDNETSTPANEVITVNDVNDPPVATPSTSSGDEDTDIPVDLTGTDSDGTVDFVTVDTLPPVAEGILYLPDGTTPVVAGTPITAADAANLIFTPEPDFNGDVTIPFTVTDDDGDTSASVDKVITVNEVNDPPVATNDGPIVVEPGSVINIDVLTNDNDVEGDPLEVIEIIDPTNPGTPLAISIGNPITLASGTVVDLLANGTLDVMTTSNASASETFDYVLSDGNLTDTGTVTISPDTDGDGVADDNDIDDDNDGILDTEEGTGDLDSDGIPNYLDLDTDGDGLTDLQESGLSSVDILALDPDGDGVINAGDTGNIFGSNGLADPVETFPESNQPDYDGDGNPDEPADTDGDGVDDYKDLDTDNDGINDVIEVGGTDADGDGIDDNTGGTDTDSDGVPDALDPSDGGTPVLNPDTDDDNVADFRDLDTDNDGINDVLEGGNEDADGNGLVDGLDTDGDGIADVVDLRDGFGDDGSSEAPDRDLDGTPNYLDLDADGDGIDDAIEGGNGDLDNDGDGVIDGSDADGDGIVDAVDLADGFGDDGDPTAPDSNGDGVPDYLQAGTNNPDNGSSTGGEDVITGGNGDDIINGLSDNDILDGGAGNDIVNGGSDLDVMLGGIGNDVLNAGSSDDEIDAGAGDDIVNAGSGNDVAHGMAGQDLLNGGSGDDWLNGGLDDDILSGGSENDSLYGEAGLDLLRGGSGDDILVGGVGADLLFGEQGDDTFRYEQVNEFGDIIFDFEIVRDRIDLSAIFNGNASLGSNVVAQQAGNNTMIMADTGTGLEQVAMLMNVNAITIDDNNFIF